MSLLNVNWLLPYKCVCVSCTVDLISCLMLFLSLVCLSHHIASYSVSITTHKAEYLTEGRRDTSMQVIQVDTIMNFSITNSVTFNDLIYSYLLPYSIFYFLTHRLILLPLGCFSSPRLEFVIYLSTSSEYRLLSFSFFFSLFLSSLWCNFSSSLSVLFFSHLFSALLFQTSFVLWFIVSFSCKPYPYPKILTRHRCNFCLTLPLAAFLSCVVFFSITWLKLSHRKPGKVGQVATSSM